MLDTAPIKYLPRPRARRAPGRRRSDWPRRGSFVSGGPPDPDDADSTASCCPGCGIDRRMYRYVMTTRNRGRRRILRPARRGAPTAAALSRVAVEFARRRRRQSTGPPSAPATPPAPDSLIAKARRHRLPVLDRRPPSWTRPSQCRHRARLDDGIPPRARAHDCPPPAGASLASVRLSRRPCSAA